jgi:hypothetical protein
MIHIRHHYNRRKVVIDDEKRVDPISDIASDGLLLRSDDYIIIGVDVL